MEIQNANPTILSLEQLPSRQPNKPRSLRKTGPGHEFDHILLAKPIYLRSGPCIEPEDEAWLPPEYDDDNEAEPEDEPIDEQEIYDLISNIADPEHPFSLGQLAVVNLGDINITPPPFASPHPGPNQLVHVRVDITPTVNHCSHATIIGLAVRVRLERCLPPNYRISVRVRQGTHSQDDQVTKQLADKERVAAALENDALVGVLNTMLKPCEQR